MKFFPAILFLSLPLILHGQSRCLPKVYMTQAMAKVTAKAWLNEYSFNTGVSLLGGYIKVSNSLPFTLTLNKGTQYAFLAGGDDDATDIDLFIENASGTVLVKDQKSSNDPELLFTPTVTSQYTIRVKMYSSRATGSFAGLAIMKKDGYSIPLANLTTTLDNLLTTVDRFCQLCNAVAFSNAQWAIFGSVVEEKETLAIMNLNFDKERRYAIVGAGDQNLEDGDLFLKDTTGKVIKEDVEADPTPMINFRNPERTVTYEVVLKNVASDGRRSLCVFALLEINCN